MRMSITMMNRLLIIVLLCPLWGCSQSGQQLKIAGQVDTVCNNMVFQYEQINTLYRIHWIGQSGADGRGTDANRPSYLDATFPNVRLDDGTGNLVPFSPTTNDNDLTGQWGSALQAAYMLSTNNPNSDFVFIKHDVGNTNLFEQWGVVSGVHYNNYRNDELNVNTVIGSEDWDVIKDVLVWTQGESDCNINAPIGWANAYQQNEADLFNDVVSRYPNIDILNVVVPNSTVSGTVSHPNGAIVRQAKQANCSNFSNVDCLNYDNYSNTGVHLDEQGYIDAGIDIYNWMKNKFGL